MSNIFYTTLHPESKKDEVLLSSLLLGAGEETLTLDLFLGKEAL